MASPPKKKKKNVMNRPKHRTLVRWDSELDELLLLTVQSVCNKLSIKIPWGDVAETMQNNVTEGAIVQHLAKLRLRRIETNKEVPPPLRRGGGLGKGSAKRAKAKDQKPSDSSDSLDTSDEEYGAKRRAKKPAKGRRSKRTKHVELETEESDVDLSDGVVGVGAQFLSYPNDKSIPFKRDSTPTDTLLSAKSKIVILRYQPYHPEFAAVDNGSCSNKEPQELAGCYARKKPCVDPQEWHEIEAMNAEESLDYVSQFADESSQYVFNEPTLEDSASQAGPAARTTLPNINSNDFDEVLGSGFEYPSYDLNNTAYTLAGTHMQSFDDALQATALPTDGAAFSFAEPPSSASYGFGQANFNYGMPYTDGSTEDDSAWFNSYMSLP